MKTFLIGSLFLFLSRVDASTTTFCLSAFGPSIELSRQDKTLTWKESDYQLQFDLEILDVKTRDQIPLNILRDAGEKLGHVKKIETLRVSGGIFKIVTTKFNTFLFSKELFYRELGNKMSCHDLIAPFSENIINDL